ncbi:MAG: serine hydrolase domain-containing protein [Bacteroidota bacterium]
MLKNTLSLLISLTIICSCQPSEDSSQPSQFVAVDQYIEEALKTDRFHGAITIANQDSILYSRQVGIANRNWDIPVAADTRFDIASVNKSFIAGLIMLAVEEGKLTIKSRLVDLLENFSYSGQFHDSITVHHLLTHSSGLPDYNSVSSDMSANGYIKFKRQHFTDQAYVDFISNLSSRSVPGTRFYYSNFAYHLLCVILEDLYQKSFPELLQEKICQPLELTNTYSSIDNQAVAKKLALGYNWKESSQQWFANNFIDLTLGRRIFSTSEDLVKWARALNDNRLFKKESRDLMTQNYLSEITDDFNYGYGWVIINPGSNAKMGNMSIQLPYIIHGGSTEGYKSMLVNIDRGKYIIAFTSNVGDRTNEMEMITQITKLILENNEN